MLSCLTLSERFNVDGEMNISPPCVRNIVMRCANQNSYELKPGELVLLKIPELLRDDWPLGKVIKVFKDSNEVIRSLESQCKRRNLSEVNRIHRAIRTFM